MYGLRHGNGAYTYPDGEVYKGHWMDGRKMDPDAKVILKDEKEPKKVMFVRDKRVNDEEEFKVSC